jgi:hypothetical protein
METTIFTHVYNGEFTLDAADEGFGEHDPTSCVLTLDVPENLRRVRTFVRHGAGRGCGYG